MEASTSREKCATPAIGRGDSGLMISVLIIGSLLWLMSAFGFFTVIECIGQAGVSAAPFLAGI